MTLLNYTGSLKPFTPIFTFIIAISAFVGVLGFAINLSLTPVKKDIEYLKADMATPKAKGRN